MAERPSVYTIPAHRAFADALVGGLMRGRDQAALARGLVLLPNNRAVRAVTEAFVRASGGGLLLPRLVALGDPELGEAVGAALDVADDPPPPAVATYARRMILARLVEEERARTGTPVSASEAVRLAGDLARTLDQLLVEEVPPARLAELDLAPELTEHWARALATFRIVIDRWPAELAKLGAIDGAERRARLLAALEARWRATPPAGFVCAAGITDTSPAVARLLRCVADMAQGQTVLAGLDLAMPQEEWDALGPHAADSGMRAIETHPQFHLKLMLEQMSIGRDEVVRWRGGGAMVNWGADADPARGRAIANALAPADFTGKWTDLAAADRRLSGVRAAELATPAEEAQTIALALRHALDTPGKTAALVTPDRALARRVAVHCRRWGITVDDSAGRPLAILPPGTLLLALTEAAAQAFAPLALLSLLKHPLANGGVPRLEWLDGVRAMDRSLRGPRPPAGLDGLSPEGRAATFWTWIKPRLEPLARQFSAGPQPLPGLIACVREAAQALCGDVLWSGLAGRAAAEFVADLEAEGGAGPALVDPAELPAMLRTLLDEVAVRPERGKGHPRLAIYGQIEARLQSADLMILSGLNEGTWPGSPPPDPWLAPRIRGALGLIGLEQRIGIAAHDFAQGLGAPEVLVTRARRDAGSPALASRLWLRLQAMAGDRFERDGALEGWSRGLDAAATHEPVERPAPLPAKRPTSISVTEVDRLKADPYSFYARRVLRLSPLDPVDADPTAAWRGTAVHDILEQWWKQDACAPDALRPRAMRMLKEAEVHPLLRALWQPRLREAIDWIAGQVVEMRASDRHVLAAEGRGEIEMAGVTLSGRYDRIDRLPGGIGIVDYKTGKPPSAAAVRAGFSLQLGLLGLIAERGGFADVTGTAAAFEYWSLAKRRDQFGFVDSPCDPEGKRDKIVTADFTRIAAANFSDVAAKWLTGNEPFTAKLVPDYAPYAEYDQLMRRDEWYGRE
ncbi:PD-(D/E)XK nuclease family protein [Microvirga sp. SRT01]|uniref:PD-(D/E)XK nuclease family protein n=1 Tax=Sphingomonas longa TaxID=2778730 RepID=A0ABS2D6U3_9SPHN|nr:MULTISPECIES: PD-(D/E)XK nuclease family protein [Alphaproteobacteria]MBM6576613.1 PD-(D/E)XK nuclease family protein [Sphingomonas sp. BT552]MBR7709659.1 PD-(D/E)XK nuclease family protein [Microvirga sp. SRT01]